MKAHEATSLEEWEKADHTPAYQAVKTQAGGYLPTDMMLQMCTTIVLDFPKPELGAKIDLRVEMVGGAESALMTAATFHAALLKKHLSAIDYRGNPKDVRQVAREVIIDILANRLDWKPYSTIFSAFAERNDQDFFEQLVRGKKQKRKPVFSKVEMYCLSNWHEWGDPMFVAVAQTVPPLKHWTASAVLSLIDLSASAAKMPIRFGEKGLYTIWKRLGLEQVHPAQISGFFPVREMPGQFKVIHAS